MGIPGRRRRVGLADRQEDHRLAQGGAALQFELELAGLAETVSVQAEVQTINTVDATIGNAFNETQAFARDIKALSTGIIWYRKHITLPADAARGKAFLEFEGVRQAAEIWVNGRSVALSEHGVMAFGADITAALKPGDNVIAVRVDNDWKYKERATGSGFQWNNDNFNVFDRALINCL